MTNASTSRGWLAALLEDARRDEAAKHAARIKALEQVLEPLVEFADYPQTCGASIHFNHNLDHNGFAQLQSYIHAARATLRGQGTAPQAPPACGCGGRREVEMVKLTDELLEQLRFVYRANMAAQCQPDPPWGSLLDHNKVEAFPSFYDWLNQCGYSRHQLSAYGIGCDV